MEKIKFIARSKTEYHLQNRPVPAAQMIPDWWREMTPYNVSPDNPDGKKFLMRDRTTNATFKKCTPMLDALTSGYMLTLWADVQVTQDNGYPSITWRTMRDIFELHGPSSRMMPAPPGYDQIVFKYLNCWIPITPPGYSTLVTAPFGHRELPFLAIPAIVDSDKLNLDIVFPMWVKTGFEGIVENGTPMIQLTPFKRTDWKSEFGYYENGEYLDLVEENTRNKTLTNFYVKNHWSKKTYK